MDCNFHLQAATNSQVKDGFNNKQEMLQATQYVLCTCICLISFRQFAVWRCQVHFNFQCLSYCLHQVCLCALVGMQLQNGERAAANSQVQNQTLMCEVIKGFFYYALEVFNARIHAMLKVRRHHSLGTDSN